MSAPFLYDGGYAFPRPASVNQQYGTLHDGDEQVREQSGMSLRDWFAGQALQGLLAGGICRSTSHLPSFVFELDVDHLVKRAFDVADAMIRQRREVVSDRSPT